MQKRKQPYVPSNCTTFEELAPIETMLSSTPGASLSQQVMQKKDIAETYNYLPYVRKHKHIKLSI
jgi:hypothetical protein